MRLFDTCRITFFRGATAVDRDGELSWMLRR